jgi:large subunit ribosomal protein L17
MRHRKQGRKFGRKTDPRRALRRDIVNALFRVGRIETTVAKAKAFRPYAERLVTVARKGAAAKAAGDETLWLTAYRRLYSELHEEANVHKLLTEIGPSFADRPGGYTRIVRLAKGRLGDNAPVCLFELLGYDPEAAAAARTDAAKAPSAQA